MHTQQRRSTRVPINATAAGEPAPGVRHSRSRKRRQQQSQEDAALSRARKMRLKDAALNGQRRESEGSRHHDDANALVRAVSAIKGDDLPCSVGGCKSVHCPDEWLPTYSKNATLTAAEYSLCSRPTMPCLAISVGLGGEVEFENALSAIGCEVHGFDPTESLRLAHSKAAQQHSWTFHPVGLAGAPAGRNNWYGDLCAGSEMLTLPQMLHRVAGESRQVHVLKVDCEGCEWQALVASTPALLRVDEFLVELHLTPQYGLLRDEILPRVLGVVSSAGLHLHSSNINPGFPKDWFRTSPALRAAGWGLRVPNQRGHRAGDLYLQMPCCVNLHFIRSSGSLQQPSLFSPTAPLSAMQSAAVRATTLAMQAAVVRATHGTLCQRHVDVQARELSVHQGVDNLARCGAACAVQPGCDTYVFNRYGACYLRELTMNSQSQRRGRWTPSIRLDSAAHETVSCVQGSLDEHECIGLSMLQTVHSPPPFAYMRPRPPYTVAQAAVARPSIQFSASTSALRPPSFNLALADVRGLLHTKQHADIQYIGAVRHQNDLCDQFGLAWSPFVRGQSQVSSLFFLSARLRPLRGRLRAVACDAAGSPCPTGYSALAAERMPVLDLRLVRVDQGRLLAHYWVGGGVAGYASGWCLDELRLHAEQISNRRNGSRIGSWRDVLVQVTALARSPLPARNLGVLVHQGRLLLLPWVGAPPVEATDAHALHASLSARPAVAHLHTPGQLGEWQHLNGNISPLPVLVDGVQMLLTIGHAHFGMVPTKSPSWSAHYYHLFVLLNATPPFRVEASSMPFCLPVAMIASASSTAAASNLPSAECESVQFVQSAIILQTSSAPVMLLSYGVHDCRSAVAHVALKEALRFVRHGGRLRLLDDPHPRVKGDLRKPLTRCETQVIGDALAKDEHAMDVGIADSGSDAARENSGDGKGQRGVPNYE